MSTTMTQHTILYRWLAGLRRAPTAPSGNGVSTRAAILLSLSSIVLMLMGLEVATRLYTFTDGRGFAEDPRTFITPFFTTEDWPAPYKSGIDYEFKDDDVITADEARRAIVVVCLGGSTTLSRNSEGKAYPRVLEGLLQEEFKTPHIRVLNAGGHAFSSAHTLVNFSLRILSGEIQPDVIVVFHNINDLSANYFGTETDPDYANKYMTDYYLGYRHKRGFVAPFLRQSRFLRFVFYRTNLLTYEYDRQPDTDYETGAAIFDRNLRSIAAVAAAHGVDVVFGTQPARGSVRGQASHKRYNEVVEQVASDVGAGMADVSGAVTEDERDFIDDVHYSASGVNKVARSFLGEVRPFVKARITRDHGTGRPRDERHPRPFTPSQ